MCNEDNASEKKCRCDIVLRDDDLSGWEGDKWDQKYMDLACNCCQAGRR